MKRIAASAGAVLVLLLGAASARAEDAKTGSFTAMFTEYHPLSDFGILTKRVRARPEHKVDGHAYKIESETFSVYVPKTYTTNEPHGLLVWIHSGDGGGMPAGWGPLMDRHKLIWVGNNKVGNNQDDFERRMPLSLDAVQNLAKRYAIATDRIYVSGFSGGGRVASCLAFEFADVFTGGIFVCGVNCWDKVDVPGKSRAFWSPDFPKPAPEIMRRAKETGRYVFLTGENDMNRQQTWASYEQVFKRSLNHTLYLMVPGMQHSVPPPEWYDKALTFADTLPAVPSRPGGKPAASGTKPAAP